MTFAALALSLVLTGPSRADSGAAPACHAQTVAKKTKLRFKRGKPITVDVVDTPMSREVGLMCRTRLPRDYGMLFVFPQEMSLNFWMKNTLVSLDIVWIGADKKITVIHDRMKKSTVSTPDEKVAVAGGRGQYVLELPAGMARRRGLNVGDRLTFDAAIPAK